MDRWKRCYTLTREIVLEGKTFSPDDDEETAALRKQLAEEIAAIRARGGQVDIPPE